jgi:hypothetical protein
MIIVSVVVVLLSSSCSQKLQTQVSRLNEIVLEIESGNYEIMHAHIEHALKHIHRSHHVKLTVLTDFASRDEVVAEFRWISARIMNRPFSGTIKENIKVTQQEIFPEKYDCVKFYIKDDLTSSPDITQRSIVQIIYRHRVLL